MPWHDDFVQSVDEEAGVIVITPPDGLLDA
jgi:ribosomal 30S subunit maturation factor RimM